MITEKRLMEIENYYKHLNPDDWPLELINEIRRQRQQIKQLKHKIDLMIRART